MFLLGIFFILQATTGCFRLLQVIQIITCYLWLLQVTTVYYMLLQATKGFYRLLHIKQDATDYYILFLSHLLGGAPSKNTFFQGGQKAE